MKMIALQIVTKAATVMEEILQVEKITGVQPMDEKRVQEAIADADAAHESKDDLMGLAAAVLGKDKDELNEKFAKGRQKQIDRIKLAKTMIWSGEHSCLCAEPYEAVKRRLSNAGYLID